MRLRYFISEPRQLKCITKLKSIKKDFKVAKPEEPYTDRRSGESWWD
jgi:hypothetical protein